LTYCTSSWFELRKIFAKCDMHSCVIDTAVTGTAVLSNQLCMNIFANNSTHCFFYKEIWLGCTWHSGVIDIAVTCTAVSMTPLWHAQWCHWHHCDFGPGYLLKWLFEIPQKT
jgi:hypothetical protein